MEKRLLTLIIIDGIIISSLVLLDFLFLREVSNLFSSILIFSIILFITPIALYKYYETWKVKSLEDFFPQFMADLAESIRSGMTLPQAVESISTNDYGRLSSYVKRLNAQLEWGIPFDVAFLKFAENTKSNLIKRISSTIIESHKYGGNLSDLFETISKTSVEVERLREERKLYMHSQMITGYVIFFVFLLVMGGLQRYLIPSLTQASVGGVTKTASSSEVENSYRMLFRNLIIIQGFFAGLVVGKLSEGTITGGIKHSLLLITIGVIIHLLLTII